MSVLFGRIGITAAPIGRRCFIALAVAFCDVAAEQLCFRFDVLRVFGAEYDLSCPSLGLSQRVCWLFDSTRFHNRSFSYPLLLARSSPLARMTPARSLTGWSKAAGQDGGS